MTGAVLSRVDDIGGVFSRSSKLHLPNFPSRKALIMNVIAASRSFSPPFLNAPIRKANASRRMKMSSVGTVKSGGRGRRAM